jgi:AraC family transcriptional regulator
VDLPMIERDNKAGAPLFSSRSPALVTPRAAPLSLPRYAPVEVGDGLRITKPAENAWVNVCQLREHPTHDFWMDGEIVPPDAAPRGTSKIVDLTADPRAE